MNFRNSKGKVERKERNDVILISKKKNNFKKGIIIQGKHTTHYSQYNT